MDEPTAHIASWLVALKVRYGGTVTFSVPLDRLVLDGADGHVTFGDDWTCGLTVDGVRYEGRGRHGLAALQALARSLPGWGA